MAGNHQQASPSPIGRAHFSFVEPRRIPLGRPETHHVYYPPAIDLTEFFPESNCAQIQPEFERSKERDDKDAQSALEELEDLLIDPRHIEKLEAENESLRSQLLALKSSKAASTNACNDKAKVTLEIVITVNGKKVSQ